MLIYARIYNIIQPYIYTNIINLQPSSRAVVSCCVVPCLMTFADCFGYPCLRPKIFVPSDSSRLRLCACCNRVAPSITANSLFEDFRPLPLLRVSCAYRPAISCFGLFARAAWSQTSLDYVIGRSLRESTPVSICRFSTATAA